MLVTSGGPEASPGPLATLPMFNCFNFWPIAPPHTSASHPSSSSPNSIFSILSICVSFFSSFMAFFLLYSERTLKMDRKLVGQMGWDREMTLDWTQTGPGARLTHLRYVCHAPQYSLTNGISRQFFHLSIEASRSSFVCACLCDKEAISTVELWQKKKHSQQ